MLGCLVNERAIEPHIPVFDKSARAGGTFSREGLRTIKKVTFTSARLARNWLPPGPW
jgi:hypothetical protein